MKYLLTVKIPYEAADDVAAREAAITLLTDMNQCVVDSEGNNIGFHDTCKLQRLKENGPPEGLEIL